MDRMKPRPLGPILVLFARPPRRGEVKTRLSEVLGEERAYDLYLAFLRDSIELLHRVSPRGIRAAIAWAGPPEPLAIVDGALGGVEVLRQEGSDLGQRMSNCIADLLARGHDRVALIGTDTPSLPLDYLHQAFDLLRDRDLVFGPATDGGYYLIGARSVVPEIFRDIEWGSSTVLKDTLKILRIFGLPRVLLQVWSDVDTVEDLEFLRTSLAALPPTDPTAKHTRAALAASAPPSAPDSPR